MDEVTCSVTKRSKITRQYSDIDTAEHILSSALETLERMKAFRKIKEKEEDKK